MAKSLRKQFAYEYPRPSLTADAVILTHEADPRVLLIRRKHEPFEGMWAIPGGFVNMDEDLETAARRELQEETGVRVQRLEQLYTFGAPARDPRGRTISVVYWGRVGPAQVKPEAADDAAAVGWHRLRRPPELAFDHARILECVRRRLAGKPFAG